MDISDSELVWLDFDDVSKAYFEFPGTNYAQAHS